MRRLRLNRVVSESPAGQTKGRTQDATGPAAERSPRISLGRLSLKRKLALGVAVVSVALGAGQFVQSNTPAGGGIRPAGVLTGLPEDVITLAAVGLPDETSLPDTILSEPLTRPVPASAPVHWRTEGPDMVPQMAAASSPAIDCTPQLSALPGRGGMIDIALAAPCLPGIDLVVRHAGLSVSGRTLADGTFHLALPAFDRDGRVAIRLADGSELAAAAPADLAGIRRIAIQWRAGDRIQLHAREGGARYGEFGHVWAGRPRAVGRAAPEMGGWIATLGDASAPMPLLAEVYTFPADPKRPVRLTVEAEVTAATCNRDLLGDIVMVEDGTVITHDLTLSMPGCDAIGDFLVLNNPMPETKLVAAAAD